MSEPLSRAIGAFAAGLEWSALTPSRREKAALAYVDFLSLAAAGAMLPEAEPATLLAEDGRVCVPGVGRALSCGGAMVALSYMGALLQLHDGFGRGGNHPSSVIVPAVHVAGRGKPLEEILAALVAGYEIANRLSAATHPEQSRRGAAPTATMGAIGAAAACGRLLGLDAEALGRAVSIAAIGAPVATYEALRLHGSAVPFHGGWAARAGWEAARLAGAGLDGGATVLEGRPGADGLLTLLAGRPAPVPDPAGWQGETLDLVFFKPVPGCRHVQPAVEAALDLREDLPADPAAIAAVAIETYPLALAFAALPDGRDELYDRLMSVPWCVASTLLRGPLEPQALAEPSAPALTALASRVSMCAAEPFVAGYPAALGARLTVTLADGRTLTSERRLAYGEAADPALLTPPGGRLAPLDRARLLARAGGFLEPAWGAGPARRLIEGALAASALA
ncbi:MmgE/PrpD family protein [uncultured Albimonas sp.]|uniref:MmgE/PrpD family protein n=1 Tax=uncultured Albimonas sp. TaxID=1331701 RepID=UPI0030EE97B3